MPTTSAVIDFGSAYTDRAEVTVTGLTSITTGSDVEAWLRATATAEHSEDEHIMLKSVIQLEVPRSSIVAGTSCKIVATCYDPPGMSGRLNVNLAYNP